MRELGSSKTTHLGIHRKSLGELRSPPCPAHHRLPFLPQLCIRFRAQHVHAVAATPEANPMKPEQKAEVKDDLSWMSDGEEL